VTAPGRREQEPDDEPPGSLRRERTGAVVELSVQDQVVSTGEGSPLALALAVVQFLHEQFDAEVIAMDLISAEQGEIRVRVRPRTASRDR
jgi:hypothetical protein